MKNKMKKVTPEKSGLDSVRSKPYYPSLDLKLKDIPEAKSWEVGKNYMLVVGVRMSSIREDEDSSNVGFKVIKVKPIENNSNKEEY